MSREGRAISKPQFCLALNFISKMYTFITPAQVNKTSGRMIMINQNNSHTILNCVHISSRKSSVQIPGVMISAQSLQYLDWDQNHLSIIKFSRSYELVGI